MPAQLWATVGERQVEVGELTFADVRAWLVEIGAQNDGVDVLHALAFDDCTLDDLARMSSISADELEQFAPSDLTDLREKAKALNPHFFRVRASLTRIARKLTAQVDSMISSAQPAP